MINYYSLLKVSPTADDHEILLAFAKFREELVKYNSGIKLNDEEIKHQCPEIWEAFLTILDTEKRKKYDEELKNLNLYEFKTFNVNRSGSGGKSMPGEYSRIKPNSRAISGDPEIYIIQHHHRKLLIKVPRIISYVGFGITTILFCAILHFSFTGVIRFPEAFKPYGYILGLVVLNLFLFHIEKFLSAICPVKEIIYKDKKIYLRYPGKPDLAIKNIVLYKYLIKDIVFINVITEKGRAGFYQGFDSSYRLQMDRDEIRKYANSAGIIIKEKFFLLINQWLEK